MYLSRFHLFKSDYEVLLNYEHIVKQKDLQCDV
jgi:hypothetical protein